MNEAMKTSRRQANIMIVDDMPANLQLLVHFLRNEGYKVRPVTSGAAALELAQHIRPDLVLMDVSMPEMDGYEACRRMKENPELKDVPIVFLSAMGDLLDKVRAFEVGGVDYITKPFHMEEVRIRIETHLRLAELRGDVEEKCRQLEASEQMKDNLVHLLIHDMRAPLFNISAALDLVSLSDSLASDAPAKHHLDDAKDSIGILEKMIADILDVYKMESGGRLVALTPAPVSGIIADAVRIMGGLMKHHRFTYVLPPPDLMALCDPALTTRVLINFFSNSVKHAASGSVIRLQTVDEGESVRISVTDQSQGVSPEMHDRLFEKFGRLTGEAGAKKTSIGLGLVFSRMVVEAQGGEIGVRSKPGEGCVFWFTLLKPPGPKEVRPTGS
jgi:two-component system, sensor histidine kinase and response regulator